MVTPHIPQKLPLEDIEWGKLVSLIAEANRELALYEGILSGIPNAEIFVAPLRLQEAVLSSRIEGTQETFEDVLRYEASAAVDPRKKDGIQEIINYREALAYAVEEMDTYPLNLNLIRRIHSMLMDSVRGKDKGRGEFRRSQVYIGARGGNIESASYVPPPPERVMEFLDNWEKYIHHEERERLVQLAIVHAQFEIIHPFLDGNGRIGRILIPLFLYEKGYLSSPVFYLSEYLEAHRDAYIDHLKWITDEGDWSGWITFFLGAIVAQARTNTQKARAVLALYEEMKATMPDITRSQYAIQALDAIFKQPIFSTATFVESMGIARRTAIDLLNKLREAEVVLLEEPGAGQRPDLLVFPALLDMIQ